MKKIWKLLLGIVLGICFVLFFSLSYSEGEIPNTIVKDNPKAEVTTVKTKERRTSPAELNIEVKKLNSLNLTGSLNKVNKEIVFDLSESGVNNEASKIITSDKVIHVTKELETYPSIATTNGRKKWSNVLEKYKTAKRTGKAVENDGLTSELVEISVEDNEVKKELKIGYTGEEEPRELYIGVLNKNTYELEKVYKYEKNELSLRTTVDDMLVLKRNFLEARIIKLNSTYSFISCGEYAHFNRMGTNNVKDVTGIGWFSTGRLNKDVTKYNGIIPFSKSITAKFSTVDGKTSENISLYLAPKEIYAGSTERSPEYLSAGGKQWNTDEILGLPYNEKKVFPTLEALSMNSWPDKNFAGTPSKSGWALIFDYGLIIENKVLNRIISENKRMIEVTTAARIPLYAFTDTSWSYTTTAMNFFNAGEIKTNLLSRRNININLVGDEYMASGSASSNELQYVLDLRNLSDIKVNRGTIENIVKTADKYTAEYKSASRNSRFKIEILQNEGIKFEVLDWNGEEIKTALNLEYIENGLKFYEDIVNIEISPTTKYEKSMKIAANGYDLVTKYENKVAVYTIYGLDEIKLGNILNEGGKTEVLKVIDKNIVFENDFNLKGITIKAEDGTTKNVVKDKDRNAVRYTSPSGESEFILEFVKDLKLGKTKLKLTINKWNKEEINTVFNITGTVNESILLNISERKTESGSAKITFSNSYTEENIAVYENGNMNDSTVTVSEANNFLIISEMILKLDKLEVYVGETLLGTSNLSTINTIKYEGTEIKIGMDNNRRLNVGLSYWDDKGEIPLKLVLKNQNNEILGEYTINIVLPTTGITVSREVAVTPSLGIYSGHNIYVVEFAGPDRVMHTDPNGNTTSKAGAMTRKYNYSRDIKIDSIEQLSSYSGIKIVINNISGLNKKYTLDVTEAMYGAEYPSGGSLYTVEGSPSYGEGLVILRYTYDRTKVGNYAPPQDYKFLIKATDSTYGLKYRDILLIKSGYGNNLDNEKGNGTIIFSKEYNGEEIELGENIKKAKIEDAINLPPSKWIYFSKPDFFTELHLIQNDKVISTGRSGVGGTVKDENGNSTSIVIRCDSANKMYLKLEKMPVSPINITYKIYNKHYANGSLTLKGTYTIKIQPPDPEKGSAKVVFADKYKAADGLQKIGGAEDSNDLVTISNISGIYPMTSQIYGETENIEIQSNNKKLGEMYIGNLKSYNLQNGTKVKLQVDKENINLGLESWKSRVNDEVTVLLKKSNGLILGKYTLNITTPKSTATLRNRLIRLQNIKDLKVDVRYYPQQSAIKANSTAGWGYQGDMAVNITDFDMTGDYIYYPAGTNFPTFKFTSENTTVISASSSTLGAYVRLISSKINGVLAIDIAPDKTGAIYPQPNFSGNVKEAFKETITITYNDGTNYYEDRLTLIIPETSDREEGSAKLKFNNAYSPSEGFLKITPSGVDPAYGELSVASGTFPPSIGELSNNFEILSRGNKVAESNMEIAEAVLKNMTLRMGYIGGKLNLMIYDWIPGKEETVELVLKNGTSEKGRYTLGINTPKEGVEIISGSDILNFGTIIKGNNKVSRSSTWMTVDMTEELEISAIQADMSDPYIYLNGINSIADENRIKILKIEAKGKKNRFEKNYYDLTVEGELEAVKETQKAGSYEGSVTLEMYIK